MSSAPPAVVASDWAAPRRAEWFGHPRGLTILFLTEMWEKFSYFGMRAMLVYYMTRQLGLTQARASLIYGLYTGCVMLTPLLGAAVSDRWLGRRRAVALGASIMAAGHLMMAFESTFYVALATIATGAGLLLPNLPSQIDGLYAPTDSRRNLAFNVYYVGINTGGVLAPFACGTIGELYGWHWGFTVAAAGMVAGLVIYLAGSRYLPTDGVDRPARAAPVDVSKRIGELRSYKLLLGLALIVTVLRGSYEQVGNTIAVWAETGIDRTVLERFTIPMTWFQSLNPLLVFSLTPFVLAHWKRQSRRGKAITSLMKMARGAGLVACAYFLLALVALWADHYGAVVSWAWLVVFFVILTTGELYVFPIGLALFARIGPARFVATSIAIWYLAGFAGNLLGGSFGTLWTLLSRAEFFAAMGAVALIAASLFLAVQYRARVPEE